MTTKPTVPERNPVVAAAAAKVRKRRKQPSAPAPAPCPDQLPLFPLNDPDPKANR